MHEKQKKKDKTEGSDDDDDERSVEEKYPGFDNDEFMLDNPTKE